MISKRLAEDQFRIAAEGVTTGQKTLDIARAVLVEGRKQSEVATQYGLTKGAISQAVTKIWDASQLPPGYERVSVVLSNYQAFLVKQWAAAVVKPKVPVRQVKPRSKNLDQD